MTSTRTALIVVDVQNDFCEGGSLAVTGGSTTAALIATWMQQNRDRYALIVGSLDDHNPDSTNAGHIALPPAEPDFIDSWPPHCIHGTPGADPHPNLDTTLIDLWVRKGHGVAAYSAFDGRDSGQHNLNRVLVDRYITDVEVVGIATDYCVKATARSARTYGFKTTLLADLTAAVHPENLPAVFDELIAAGVSIAIDGRI